MLGAEGCANQEHVAPGQPVLWADISCKCLALDHPIHVCVFTQNISLGKTQLQRRPAEMQEAESQLQPKVHGNLLPS